MCFFMMRISMSLPKKLLADFDEVLKERGTKVNLEHLKRFYSANFQKKIAIKEEKAEFYKLIPYLEEIILNILQKDPDNNYILIFDDLDVFI